MWNRQCGMCLSTAICRLCGGPGSMDRSNRFCCFIILVLNPQINLTFHLNNSQHCGKPVHLFFTVSIDLPMFLPLLKDTLPDWQSISNSNLSGGRFCGCYVEQDQKHFLCEYMHYAFTLSNQWNAFAFLLFNILFIMLQRAHKQSSSSSPF